MHAHVHTCTIIIYHLYFAEPVVSFALEPTGSKFIVIHGEPPTRIMASFYNINDKGNKVTLISKSNFGAIKCTSTCSMLRMDTGLFQSFLVLHVIDIGCNVLKFPLILCTCYHYSAWAINLLIALY